MENIRILIWHTNVKKKQRKLMQSKCVKNCQIWPECIEKIRRIENKIAFIYTSMVIVIENKCDTAYLDFIKFFTHTSDAIAALWRGSEKKNIQGILRVQSISMGHFCHGIRQQQKLHQFRFHWVKIVRFSGHYI